MPFCILHIKYAAACADGEINNFLKKEENHANL